MVQASTLRDESAACKEVERNEPNNATPRSKTPKKAGRDEIGQATRLAPPAAAAGGYLWSGRLKFDEGYGLNA